MSPAPEGAPVPALSPVAAGGSGWAPDFYKTSYEGFERAENFRDPRALASYRELLIQKTSAQIAFIERQFGRRPLRVLELCSGNGRLLVALAKRGLLSEGVGVEISESRTEFARRWVDDEKLREIRLVRGDALAVEAAGGGEFDLAVCITGAFGYFKPVAEDAPRALLRKMRGALRPRGLALLEIYQLPDARRSLLALNDNHLRTWQPLPDGDPFAFYLEEFRFWPERQALRHDKTFIARDGSIDRGRYEVLGYHRLAELHDLLASEGFGERTEFGSFEEDPYRDGVSPTLVCLAEAGAAKAQGS